MKVKLTNPNANAPFRANPTDAGADLFSPIDVMIPAHGNVKIDTGVIVQLPKSTVGLLFGRSGLSSKYGVRPRNCVGVIDEKYRGEVGVVLENASDDDYYIFKGERIAQLVVMPVFTPEIEVVDELDMEDDRCGGFGSTGK